MYSIIEYFTPVVPNELMLHALFSSVTKNALRTLHSDMYRQPTYKIWDEGQRIFIVVDESNTDLFGNAEYCDVTLLHQGEVVLVKFIEKRPFTPSLVQHGARVNVMGVINYARNIQGKHFCPIKNDRFVHAKDEHNFREYFQRQSGIVLNEVRAMHVPHQKLPSPKSASNNNTIVFHTVFGLQGSGSVENADKATLLQVSSIGKKRSYGFGHMVVNIISEFD